MKHMTVQTEENTGTSKKRLGNKGEDLAVEFLIRKGYNILTRNYRALHAEIDIICEDKVGEGTFKNDLVFVEVKTRTTRSHGSPVESISSRKISHIKRAAKHYLYNHGIEDRNCRFDVVGIQMMDAGPEIGHIRDVLDY